MSQINENSLKLFKSLTNTSFCVKCVAVITGFCLFQLVVCEDPDSLTSSILHSPYYSYVSPDEATPVCSEYSYNVTCCNENEFQCANGNCIPKEKVCDSKGYDTEGKISNDCGDSSDEHGCTSSSCATRSVKCEHSCIDLPGNRSRCTCYKGFILKYSYHKETFERVLSCVDIDECRIGDHMCSHKCINLNGTFKCECSENSYVDSNGYHGTCKTDNQSPVVLYNSFNKLYYFSVETNERKVIVRADSVLAIDYDPIDEIIYWLNDSHLLRSYIPGAKLGDVTVGHPQPIGSTIYQEGVVRNSLIVDWTTENLYWQSVDPFNSNYSYVMMSRVDGRYIRTLFKVPRASSLALHPYYGVLYWLSGGKIPHIGSKWLLSDRHDPLIFLDNQVPVYLALDTLPGVWFNSRFYWVNTETHTIYFSVKEGRRPSKVITTTPERSPIALDVYESHVYWLTRDSNELLRTDKFGRGEIQVVLTGLVNATVFKIYDQVKVNSELDRIRLDCDAKCSHLCFREHLGFKCYCPNGDSVSYVRIGEVCESELEDPVACPLACNCKDKEKVCNSTSRYRRCACNAHCPDGLSDVDYDDEPQGHEVDVSYIKIIMFVSIFVVLCVVCLVLVYKWRSGSLNCY